MPIDTSLIGNVRPISISDLNYKAALTANAESQMEDRGRKINRDNAIFQALQNRPKNVSPGQHLINQGYADEGIDFEKKQAEVGKIGAENKEKEIANHLKMLNTANMAMREMLAYPRIDKTVVKGVLDNYYRSGLTDEAIYQKQMAELPNIPDDDQGIRNFINQQSQALLKSEDYIKQNFPSAYEKMQAENAQRGQDIQLRGQDITQQNNLANQGFEGERIKLIRDDKDFDQSYKRGQQELDRKKYDLEVQKATNPKMVKPTEAQSKAALYANRMQEAENILSTLDYSPAALGTKEALSNTPLVGGMLGAGANAAMSSDSQQAEQAQRNFINAVLRRESGAVISPSEFDNAKSQYFPKVGDSQQVLAQKAQNRRTAIEALKAEAQGSLPGMQRAGSTESFGDEDAHINAIAKQRGVDPEVIRKIIQLKRQGNGTKP